MQLGRKWVLGLVLNLCDTWEGVDVSVMYVLKRFLYILSFVFVFYCLCYA